MMIGILKLPIEYIFDLRQLCNKNDFLTLFDYKKYSYIPEKYIFNLNNNLSKQKILQNNNFDNNSKWFCKPSNSSCGQGNK